MPCLSDGLQHRSGPEKPKAGTSAVKVKQKDAKNLMFVGDLSLKFHPDI